MRLWALLLILLSLPAHAAESALFQTAHDTVSLVSDQDRVPAGGTLVIGLRVHTQEGWNIYWQNPGDAGQAPEVDLTLPAGATSSGIIWPPPALQPESGIVTYGYQGDIVLPIRIKAGQAGDLAVKASASWLVCKNVCVPEQHDFSLTIPQGPSEPSPQAGLIGAWLAKAPVASPFDATISADGNLLVKGAGLSSATVHDAWFFPQDWGPIDISAPETLSVSDGAVALKLKPGTMFKPAAHLAGVLVLHDPMGGESDLAIDALPGNGAAGNGAGGNGAGGNGAAGNGAAGRGATLSWSLVLYAFLGGLILNLMPCVFPILAMKAMALARMAGASRAHVRGEAGYYTLGVVVSFAALGGLLALVRAFGGDQGWGFQFQSPVFVALMAALMLAVALNLAGMFEFNARFWMPRQGGNVGSFLTGLLAVLLATPCTAPFMAVAVAGALQAPPALAAAIFVGLGVGMASPYALLVLAPGLARFLPRPGPWMGWLRRGLSVPMFAAMIWLLWVASQQVTAIGLFYALILLLFVALGLYGLRRFQNGGTGQGLLVNAIAASAMILLSVDQIASHPTGIAADQATSYTPARLASLRAAGKPVFVDMTAAWCVTCLVNERVALEPDAVKQAFAQHDVAYLKGDWTNQDPAITQFLHQYGRDGVPLYVYYPAGNGAGQVLPQILSPQLVLSQLSAGG